jgi:putative ABC transport system substrate-binding protein
MNEQFKTQKRKLVGIFVLGSAFATCGATAWSQPAKKIPRIGFLVASFPASVSTRLDAFRERLGELGYTEGKTVLIESRYAEGQLENLPTLAAELVNRKVDVILSSGPAVTRPAKEVTKTIPIVMAQDDDPVGNGFIASLARPGGNITGLSSLAPEISGKRLELLKQIIPQLARVAVLGSSATPGTAQGLKETELAAGALKIQTHYQDIKRLGDIEPAFRDASQWRAEAVLVLGGPVLNSDRTRIVNLVLKYHLPATYNVPEFVEAGGLMSYGVSFVESYRRAAVFVDKILRGAKPADLAVEQPRKFELIINLKAAKQIELSIPSHVLSRADRVIR